MAEKPEIGTMRDTIVERLRIIDRVPRIGSVTEVKMEIRADMVFFDPYSPKRMPELWTPEVFRLLFEQMAAGGVLTTYSCARRVRAAMRQAGFTVQDSSDIGR